MADRRKGLVRNDPYCKKILCLCFNNSRTANFLSMKLNIPIAVCLSKLNALQKSGFLVKERKVRTSQGKWVQLYSSLVQEVEDGQSSLDSLHEDRQEVEDVIP
jgi:hypothetical protein